MVDTSHLSDLLRVLEDGQTVLSSRIAGRQIRAMRELLRVARSVVHVRSGRLRDSLYVIAPSLLGDISESSIRATVSYAETEADKGGEHDYPARTIEDGAGVLDQLTDDLAALLEAACTGGGRL